MTEAELAPIDPEYAAALDVLAAAERAAQARGFITAFTIASYLQGHRQPERQHDLVTNQLSAPAPMDWLACDEARLTWLVRWPNGQTRWDTAARLARLGFTPPAMPILGVLEGTEVA